MTGDSELRHGQPQPVRNERRGLDKYRWPAGPHWPRGLELTIYDDGRVKVGGWYTSAVVLDVSSFGAGGSNPSGHVVARFQPVTGGDHPVEAAAVDDSDEDVVSSSELLADADDESGDEDAYERATWAAIEECKHLRRRYDPQYGLEWCASQGLWQLPNSCLLSETSSTVSGCS